MKIPHEFENKRIQGKVYKLKKSLYGLKQSPRALFERFRRDIISFGYQQINTNYILFIKHYENKFTFLIIYLNDIIVIEDYIS